MDDFESLIDGDCEEGNGAPGTKASGPPDSFVETASASFLVFVGLLEETVAGGDDVFIFWLVSDEMLGFC